MNQTKFKMKMASMSVAAQKAYAALPLETPATAAQVRYSAKELNLPVPQDIGILTGCLYALERAALVIEGPRGSFRRTPVRETVTTTEFDELSELDVSTLAYAADDAKQAPTPETAPQPEVPQTATPNRVNTVNTKQETKPTVAPAAPVAPAEVTAASPTIKKIEALAAQIAALQNHTASLLVALGEVTDAHLADVEANAEAVGKLKQLQALLKGL